MNQALPDFFSAKEKTFDLKATLYHYLLSHWYWYLLFPILGYIGAWAYLRYTVPEYEVKCTLLIKDEQKGGISETALLQELGVLQETKNIENEVQILKSQTLMEEVVRELNLRVRYFAIGRVRNEEMYRNNYIRLDSFQLNRGDAAMLEIQCLDSLHFNLIETEAAQRSIAFGTWFETPLGRFFITRQHDNPVLDQGKALIQIQSTESMARGYIKHLLVKPVSYYSSVLELKLREPIARRGADVLNKLVDVYNRAAVEDKTKVSENTVAFIDQRLLYLTEELSVVERGVQLYKQKNQITTSIESGMNLVLEEISEYDQSLTQWEVQRNVLQNLATYIENMRGGQYQLIPVNLGMQESALTQLVQQFNEKLLDRNRLAQTAKAENPARIGLDLELKSVYESVLETLRKVMARTEAQLMQARNKRLSLNDKVREVPRMERELQEIMRQQTIKQNLYLFLLQKREETLLALASTSANSRVVDPARPSKLPIKPQKKLVYILSVLLGLAFPPLLILLKDLLNDTVQGENDLQKACDAPILGGIAFSKSQNRLIVGPKSRSAGAEMFRLLRTNLQFLLPPNPTNGQTLLITSSASGDGKTFVTANLGMTIALSGKKTLLLELDLRKPKLLRYLDAPPGEKGMTHYLLGQATQRDIIHPSKQHENLYYIPSGPIPPNPAELLLSPALDTLFEELQTEFDFILIDTSPVGLVADALLLNRFSSASMYVVRQGATKKGMLKTLVNVYQEKKLSNLAVIINGIQTGRGTGYGYGYGGYGYGYYEDDAHASPGFWAKWRRRFF